MANTALVQAKIEPELKIEVEKYLNDFGLDISTAIRIFFKKIVQEQRIPFKIGKLRKKEPSYIPNEEFAKRLDKAIDDIENDRDILHFNSNDEAFTYLKGLMKK
jgi:DNA-damage-inducible protein J